MLWLGPTVADPPGVESFDWDLRVRPDFDLAITAVPYRIGTNPIVKSKNKSPPEGVLAIVFQYGEST
jgi:hypothetical protein